MVPDFLENSVVRFVHLLRRLGVRIGSGEVIDALAALMLVDLSERETVRVALKATLVKRPGEREVFDKAFDVFLLLLKNGNSSRRHTDKRRKLTAGYWSKPGKN